jgi:hypothetical protein
MALRHNAPRDNALREIAPYPSRRNRPKIFPQDYRFVPIWFFRTRLKAFPSLGTLDEA